jgi:hypothetical protein
VTEETDHHGLKLYDDRKRGLAREEDAARRHRRGHRWVFIEREGRGGLLPVVLGEGGPQAMVWRIGQWKVGVFLIRS